MLGGTGGKASSETVPSEIIWIHTQHSHIFFYYQGNGLVNVWSNRFDNTAYADGDAMSRHDDELQQLLEFTWQVANFTDENKTKVHQYIIDQAYAYGLFLAFLTTVSRADIPITSPLIASSGEIDYPASIFKL